MEHTKLKLAASILMIANGLVPICVARGPEPGSQIPEFSVADQKWESNFRSLRGEWPHADPYRSADWCACCKTLLVELEESRAALAKRGWGIAAISYDSTR